MDPRTMPEATGARARHVWTLCFPILVLSPGCGGRLDGSQDAPESPAVVPGELGTEPRGPNGENGRRMDWRLACDRVRTAKLATYNRLHCEKVGRASFLPDSYCQDSFRVATAPCDAPFDEGTVSHCEDLLQTYTSCGDFSPETGNPCVLRFYPSEALNQDCRYDPTR